MPKLASEEEMIDKKIEEILQKVHDSAVSKNHDPRLGYSQKAVEQLKSLFKEYAMEIIGEDTKIDETIEPGAYTANQLRAEQREKLLTITEEDK